MGSLVDVQRFYADELQDNGALIEKYLGAATQVRDDAIATALHRFSERVPLDLVQLYQPVSTSPTVYALPSVIEPITGLAAPWVKNFSKVVTIEFPLAQVPPVYLAEKTYGVQRNPTGDLIYITANPSGPFNLLYTTRHVKTAALWSGPDEMSEPLALMAVNIVLGAFADRYGHSVESNNDGVNWRTKSQEFRDLRADNLKRINQSLRFTEIQIWKNLSTAKSSAYRRY